MAPGLHREEDVWRKTQTWPREGDEGATTGKGGEAEGVWGARSRRILVEGKVANANVTAATTSYRYKQAVTQG